MKSKKMLVLVLTICLFVGGVSLGIHLLHKDAHAVATYIIDCSFQGGGGAEGVGVRITIDGEGSFQGYTDENGLYTKAIGEPAEWTSEMIDTGYTLRQGSDPNPAEWSQPGTALYIVLAN